MTNETSSGCKTLYNKLNTFVTKVINRNVQPQIDDLEFNVNSLNNSITNFFDNNTFLQIWTDNANCFMYVNKAIGIGFLHFNKNVTVNANSQLTIKNAYDVNSTESGYCPNVAIYTPTSRTNIFLNMNYLGQIQVQNRSNSNLTNANVQGMLIWRTKGYP